jgi:hypothetical protein
MSEPLVLSALKRKRAELAGHADHLQERLVQVRADIVHVDATLHILGYQEDPSAIPNKRRRTTASLFAKGELQRIVLDLLRTAPDGLTVAEIVSAIMERNAWDGDDRALLHALKHKVGNVLLRLGKRGLVVPTAEGKGVGKVWRLTRQ